MRQTSPAADGHVDDDNREGSDSEVDPMDHQLEFEDSIVVARGAGGGGGSADQVWSETQVDEEVCHSLGLEDCVVFVRMQLYCSPTSVPN